MSWYRNSRKYHKWLMLFVGFQFVVWSVSGAFMVIFDLDYIHGDSLIVNEPGVLNKSQINYSIAKLYRHYPNAKNVELTNLQGNAVYRFSNDKGKHLLNADTGSLLSPINENYAVGIAKYSYIQPDTTIKQVSLITENPPFELSARHLPVWRVDFEGFSNPSLYISTLTGEIVTKRHLFWRIFDWMFSFHVMDYVEEDASNKLLFVFIVLSLVASLFGLILTYFYVFKRNSNKKKIVKESV
ncbi:PepSY domain-containing protein [Colwellia sp. 4_MG-2023]|uniref:PepSY domain-containing protein n=1 Tax=unclassified Colwellia TaxID=196834 RepID=UPI0026E475F6|nr:MULTISPECIES: PepSY domain-containing protein [unclassified Colwellia]MDO6508404.1 PepSY domain-containing protein [Colwellia sp. 5_MG-2023]MDO6557020.1 PepSY domain-containing protein [Colwellia sp. 4_MG-2023]